MINDIIKRIEEDKISYIDKKVLIMAFKLIYYCAVKPGELINLKIKDVQDKDGNILNKIIIKISNKIIKLDENIKSDIQEYITYLKENNYKLLRNSPLIPSRKKSKFYYYKKIMRHSSIYTNGKSLEKIRQKGICDYHKNINDFSGYKNKFEKTAEHAQCTVRHVKGILEGRIQPAGKSKYKYIKKIDRYV